MKKSKSKQSSIFLLEKDLRLEAKTEAEESFDTDEEKVAGIGQDESNIAERDFEIEG